MLWVLSLSTFTLIVSLSERKKCHNAFAAIRECSQFKEIRNGNDLRTFRCI